MNRIRSKRNFKSLQLDVSAQPPIPQEPDPVPLRPPPPANKPGATAGGAKKRPPPMNLLKPKAPIEQPSGEGSAVGIATGSGTGALADGFLTVTSGPTSAPASGGPISASSKRMTYHTTLSNKLASLDMSAEVKYDLRDEDLKDLNELGQGNGGSVKKVEHVPTHTIMAKKVRAFFLRNTWTLSLPPPPLVRARSFAHMGVCGRSFLSTRSHPFANRSCASCRSCMTVTRNTSFRSTAHSCLIPTFASAWSLWTRVRSMAFTNA